VRFSWNYAPGGKHHIMPCHQALAAALRADIDAPDIAADKKGFCSVVATKNPIRGGAAAAMG
jgi:hypothetical protein